MQPITPGSPIPLREPHEDQPADTQPSADVHPTEAPPVGAWPPAAEAQREQQPAKRAASDFTEFDILDVQERAAAARSEADALVIVRLGQIANQEMNAAYRHRLALINLMTGTTSMLNHFYAALRDLEADDLNGPLAEQMLSSLDAVQGRIDAMRRQPIRQAAE